MQASSDKDIALIVTGFFLGIEISESVLKLSPGAIREEEVINMLSRIAAGEDTVLPSAADIRMVSDVEDAETVRRDNQRLHEVVSKLILAWLDKRLG